MGDIKETPNFRQQALATDKLMDHWREAMRREGWVYHDRQGYWYHPNRPGITVTEG